MSTNNSRVLGMILKGYPRISETFISGEILGLERLGMGVRIISMRKPRESFTHESVKRIKARADYLPSRFFGNLARLAASNAACAFKRPKGYAKALKLALKRLARTRKSATLKHLFQAGYMAERILPGSGVSHLHAHFAHSPASVARFASLITGLPFSFTAHAKDIYTQDPESLSEKLGAAKFAVTCTNYNLEHLRGLASPKTPLFCVYHGIDLSLFADNGADPSPAPPYRILTVARLTAKKGVPTVLKALRLLKDKGVDFTYTLIGTGEMKDEITALVESLGLAEVVDMPGVLPHERVLDHYRRAHVFAMGCEIAATGDRDGIPNVIAEAMAMAVPVAATNVSGIPELVRHGETGLLCEPGDPEALADNVLALLTDFDLRSTVAAKGRAMVEKVFDNRPLASELARIYAQQALSGGNGARN